MDRDIFWALIERSRATDCAAHARALQALVAKLDPPDILAFLAEFDARLAETYRWDLWGVAYLINAGCSDDGFEYFRCWLIAQGRKYFEAALAQPERAADRAPPGDAECEPLLYAAYTAYQERTGTEPPANRSHRLLSEPGGERWTEDDLPRLFPAVAARFDR